METIIRNVRDIDSDERHVLEHVLGQPLRENQQVIFQVVTPPPDDSDHRTPTNSALPDWCDVYRGLREEEIAEVEGVIRRRSDLTRPAE